MSAALIRMESLHSFLTKICLRTMYECELHPVRLLADRMPFSREAPGSHNHVEMKRVAECNLVAHSYLYFIVSPAVPKVWNQ